MLKAEEINGKMYQPVEIKGNELQDKIKPCATGCAVRGLCRFARCMPEERKDGLDIYYINIEGE